jgi:hypothetical protein
MDRVVDLYRRRHCSARRRHALSRTLRRTLNDRSNPFIPSRRVRLVSDKLVMLAQELESAEQVDLATMLELERFLFDGRDSPLLNRSLPLSTLTATITDLRFRVLTSGLTLSDDRSAQDSHHRAR